jgi:hypothetical protein
VNEFITRIAKALMAGRAKVNLPITPAEALVRARQVADALPQLTEKEDGRTVT